MPAPAPASRSSSGTSPVWEDDEHKLAAPAPARALRLAARGGAAARARRRRDFDALVVGYPGHLDLPAARRAARGRPVVFNPLVSLADTLVGDRGRFRPGSLAGARARGGRPPRVPRRRPRRRRHRGARAASSPARRRSRERVAVCLVGAEERLFSPAGRPREPLHALFVGKLIPLHGLETILAAARLAPELRFRVVGSGQLDALLATRPPNVEHVPWVEYERLPDELHARRLRARHLRHVGEGARA